jgi:DNA primase
LRRKANSGGGEYAGPCPFCGGKDRFRVQPNMHRWLCRYCTNGKWQDVIAFAQRLWPGDDFPQVLERLGGKRTPATPDKGKMQAYTPGTPPIYTAPDDTWQTRVMGLIGQYEQALWSQDGKQALDYLRSRGIRDDTIRHFRLGYRAFPRGISIPGIVNGQLWYLKFRQSNPKHAKYICETGSKPAALFNADEILPGYCGLAVEGEFDTMLAWQEFGEFLPAFTTGSTTNHLDLATWGRYLLRPNYTLILPDNDMAGEVMARVISSASKNPIMVALPDSRCKDLTDYYLAGGNLSEWAMGILREYDPVPDSWDEFARSIGAVIRKLDSNSGFTLASDLGCLRG